MDTVEAMIWRAIQESSGINVLNFELGLPFWFGPFGFFFVFFSPFQKFPSKPRFANFEWPRMRLVRVARIIRMLRFFSELRVMVNGALGARTLGRRSLVFKMKKGTDVLVDLFFFAGILFSGCFWVAKAKASWVLRSRCSGPLSFCSSWCSWLLGTRSPSSRLERSWGIWLAQPTDFRSSCAFRSGSPSCN